MKEINILLVEDEKKIREIVSTYCRANGYRVFEASNGAEAFRLLKEQEFQLGILDVMLPDTDGWCILRQIRQNSSLPVIMLTARSEEDDKLLGFDLGADDYLTKPFSAKELMARIKVLLKRNNDLEQTKLLRIGNIAVNTAFHQVMFKEKEVMLTPLEYDLLLYLIENRNIALSRDQILNGVWGIDYFGDERTVDTHVKRLRKKVDPMGEQIITVRAVGYKMVDKK